MEPRPYPNVWSSKRQLEPQPKERTQRMRKHIPGNFIVAVMATAAAAFLATSCATSTMDLVTGERTRNFYSVSDEIALGNQTFEEMKAQMAKDGTGTVSRDARETRRVENIAARIFDATGMRDTFDFSVTLFESEVVNAFAVPGGKIAVFTGIWDPKKGLVSGDDELAAVIAHETAHVVCRHSTEAMTKQMPMQLVLSGLGVFAATQEDSRWQTVADSAFQLYNGLVVPKYSRTDEFEADSVSMQYMARAGFDPAAAVRLWKRAYEKEGATPGYMSILSTHPSNKARYEALQRQLPSAQALRGEASGTPTARTSNIAPNTSSPVEAPGNPGPRPRPGSGIRKNTLASPPSATPPPNKAHPPKNVLPPSK